MIRFRVSGSGYKMRLDEAAENGALVRIDFGAFL